MYIFPVVSANIYYHGFYIKNGVPFNGSFNVRYSLEFPVKKYSDNNTTCTADNGVYILPIDLSPYINSFKSADKVTLLLKVGDEIRKSEIELTAATFAIKTKTSRDSLPVGTIIPVYPTDEKPNPKYWQLCHGTPTERQVPAESILFTEYKIIEVPELMDQRYLMGGNTYGIGGTNILRQHAHTFDIKLSSESHSHTMPVWSLDPYMPQHYHPISRTDAVPRDIQVNNMTFADGRHNHIISYFIVSEDKSYEPVYERFHLKIWYYIKIN